MDKFYEKLMAGGIAVTKPDVKGIFKEIESANRRLSEVVAYQVAYEEASRSYEQFKSDFHGKLLKRNIFLRRVDIESFVGSLMKANANVKSDKIDLEKALEEAKGVYEHYVSMRKIKIEEPWDKRNRRVLQLQ